MIPITGMPLTLWKRLGRSGCWMMLVGALGLPVFAPQAAPPARAKPAAASSNLAEQARELLKRDQLPEAERLLRQCLEADPNAAQCHLLLGSALARSHHVDEAATHYRDFLRLAPQDHNAPKVKMILEAYDKSRAGR